MAADPRDKSAPVTLSSDAEAVVKQVGIPAQPTVVLEIYKEFKKKEPSLKTISNLVATDASLSARVIKVINSPFYGLPTRVASIQQAVTMLGLKNFFRVVLTATLREVLAGGSGDKRLEKLWQHTAMVAKTAEFLATWMSTSISPEDAYMAGLFHDCAIPILIKKFDSADLYFGHDGEFGAILLAEEEFCHTNHALVGGIMAKSWGMGLEISHAIKYHHAKTIGDIDDTDCQSLWFVLRLADFAASYLFWKNGMSSNEYTTFNVESDTDFVSQQMYLDKATLEVMGVDKRAIRDVIIDMNDLLMPEGMDL